MHPSIQPSHGAVLLYLHFSACWLWFVCFVLFLVAGRRRSEAAVGPQPDHVPRKPLRVGERPGRIPQPQPDGPGHRAHAQQLLPRSVEPRDCDLLLKARCPLISCSSHVQITHTALRERSSGASSRAWSDAALTCCQICSTTVSTRCSGSWTDRRVRLLCWPHAGPGRR